MVGADVARRLLAADVLLARLQREHEAAPALEVDGLADEAAGDAAHQLGGDGHVAEAGAAEVHRVAERLGLADDDVGAEPAGRLEQAERDRVGDHDEERAGRVRQLGDGGQVLERAEEVGLLDDDRRRVLADGGGEGVQVGGRARQQTDGLRARPVPGRLRGEHLPVLGVHAGREDDLAAARLHAGEERGLGQRRAAVVHGGVADVHAGELADGRLELEDGLQHALAALRLVGRVGGEELAAADDGVDHGGHVVVVDAGAEEAHQLRRRDVLAGQAPQLGDDLGLTEAGGQRQRLPPAHGLRDLGEEVVDAGGPDGRQHLPHVAGAVRDVPGRRHGGQASSRNFL